MHIIALNLEHVGTIRISHSRILMREFGVRQSATTESRLVGSPLATRDSSLAICDLEGPKSPVMNPDSWLEISQVANREWPIIPPVVTSDLQSRFWLANLTRRSRIWTVRHESSPPRSKSWVTSEGSS